MARYRELGGVTKSVPLLFVLPLFALVHCRNESPRSSSTSRPERTATAPARTTEVDVAAPVAPPTKVANTPPSEIPGETPGATPGAPAPSSVADASSPGAPSVETRLQIFKVGAGTCDRAAQPIPLLPGLFGAFTNDRVELEVRGVTYSCDPAPELDPMLENNTVHLRMLAPAAAARARCACRHNQDFHLTGLPRGDYVIVLEQLDRPNATPRQVSTGRIVASRDQLAGSAPAPSASASQ